MQLRNPIQALDDVLREIEFIENATRKKSLLDILGRPMESRAIERSLQVISEACRFVPPALTDLQADVAWKRIIALGNVLRHDYSEISKSVIAEIIRDHLAPLKKACHSMRREINRKSESLETLMKAPTSVRKPTPTKRKSRQRE